jgi:hypothetical protein
MLKHLTIAVTAVLFTTAMAEAQCPRVGAPREQFTLREDFTPDPIRQSVTAGGNLDLGRCSGVPGRGWVTELPDFVVFYRTNSGNRADTTLTFTTESNTDTILLINDPNNRWYWDDDSGQGLNGKIRFPRALNGRYDIWVGTFDRGNFTRVQLIITELD